MFNTLKYVKILEDAGFTRIESEATVNIMAEVMESSLSSKQDLKDLEGVVRELDKKLEHSIAQVKSDLTVRMGTMLAASITIIITLQKFIINH